jgi:outer membrane beta-barrel protein
MRVWLPCALMLLAFAVRAEDGAGDTITAVQRKPLRQAGRLELQPYGEMSIGDPYLQRFGAGLRAMWHMREGLSFGLDGNGLGTWATEDLVIAKRELHARIVESRTRMTLAAFAAIAPLYGKVALPGDVLVHFETFLDAGLGAAWTETDATRGVRPMIAAGIGQRMFLGENVALTARVGGNLYAERVVVDGTQQTKAMGYWTLRLGLAYYFGGGR